MERQKLVYNISLILNNSNSRFTIGVFDNVEDETIINIKNIVLKKTGSDFKNSFDISYSINAVNNARMVKDFYYNIRSPKDFNKFLNKLRKYFIKDLKYISDVDSISREILPSGDLFENIYSYSNVHSYENDIMERDLEMPKHEELSYFLLNLFSEKETFEILNDMKSLGLIDDLIESIRHSLSQRYDDEPIQKGNVKIILRNIMGDYLFNEEFVKSLTEIQSMILKKYLYI